MVPRSLAVLLHNSVSRRSRLEDSSTILLLCSDGLPNNARIKRSPTRTLGLSGPCSERASLMASSEAPQFARRNELHKPDRRAKSLTIVAGSVAHGAKDDTGRSETEHDRAPQKVIGASPPDTLVLKFRQASSPAEFCDAPNRSKLALSTNGPVFDKRPISNSFHNCRRK